MANKVITFYSYKGGVGRSMAMANIAVLLAQWGYKTLIIDWDLEAPGLENFFSQYINIDTVVKKKGLIDLLNLKVNMPQTDVASIMWDEYISHINIDKTNVIDIITAGERNEQYIENVRQFDFTSFYKKSDGGQYLEDLREYWLDRYNFILIDSRTGLTDSSGICSIHMPDVLVLLFTPNDQSFYGIKSVAQKAITGQKQIIYDRFTLRTLPVPSRIEYQETDLLDKWMTRIYNDSNDMLDWLPRQENNLTNPLVTPAQLLNLIKIPYKTFYAYGERLAVKERGTHDPQDIGYSYETIAAVLVNDFQKIDMLIDSRDSYLKKAKGEDYTDVSHFNKKIRWEQEEKKKLEELLVTRAKRSKYRQIVFTTTAIVLIMVAAIYFKSFTTKSARTDGNAVIIDSAINKLNDSLASKEAYLNFVKAYNTGANQFDFQFNLDLIKQYYTLEKNYRDSALDIKKRMEDVVAYRFIEVVKSYYASLQSDGFKASTFFEDTVLSFGALRSVNPAFIQARVDSIKRVKKIENEIADRTTITYESDPLGFNIKYVEKGNILIDQKQEYKNLVNVVTVQVSYNYKIKEFGYMIGEGIPLAVIGQKPVLELFFCKTDDKNSNQMAADIVNVLTKANKYKVYARNNFKIPADTASPYYISSNEIRYNGPD
jgi:cellulose biosynthesis protein BcsQ